MLIIFIILIILSAVILGAIVLIQNPKGGGLSGSFGGIGNQLMGVKQTTDILEKGTWIFAGLLAILCILSPMFIPKEAGSSSKSGELIQKTSATPPAAPSGNTGTLPGNQPSK
ncbi:preprotein translocase subunit SecG [Ferruginibacter albus]|uniref:preprotein translocase subunit SecG n=1 Tax=Ferruginibacter albus TaxID=2875540 RepID=UPI001CC6DABD|nr:preprotein translocase subunit SecG [Ferruginibacter albus]UAY51053.1 preprotein translocase subunit SecG [Ferruginibacter albus]